MDDSPLGPPPPASSKAVSHVMKANKHKNTKPELQIRKALWAAGIRGYRVNYKGLPGSPDICFTRWRLAVFINGCYWHRCPYCKPSMPKTNVEFWQKKFERNIARDKRKRKQLREMGWSVITIWECKLKKDPERQVQRILDRLSSIMN
jgi:DNA mismatch endonuclease, patch repair protein